MIRDVVSHLDYTWCANISLVIFVAVFCAVTIKTLFFGQDSMQKMASIPLDESRKERDE